jgi:hypothetical protein
MVQPSSGRSGKISLDKDATPDTFDAELQLISADSVTDSLIFAARRSHFQMTAC